jgi:hypothetical protein
MKPTTRMPSCAVAGLHGAEAVAAHADDHAGAEESQKGEGPVDQHHAARRFHEPLGDAEGRPDVPAGEHDHESDGQTENEADDVGQTDIAPPAAIKPEENADGELNADDDGHAPLEGRKELRRNGELEPQQPGERVRGGEHHRVEEEQDDDAGDAGIQEGSSEPGEVFSGSHETSGQHLFRVGQRIIGGAARQIQ